ncbi:hypothetical protein AAFN46_00915 [Pseudomonas sp. CAU 1711]|uniref:hypothetical protein n=1 Tax=Pseudomonas sp. CAU 1711 TaxID=3140356 RepID=UPI0032608090
MTCYPTLSDRLSGCTFVGQPVLVDGELRLAPIIREPVLDGRVALSGFDSLDEAEALVRDWGR